MATVLLVMEVLARSHIHQIGQDVAQQKLISYVAVIEKLTASMHAS